MLEYVQSACGKYAQESKRPRRQNRSNGDEMMSAAAINAHTSTNAPNLLAVAAADAPIYSTALDNRWNKNFDLLKPCIMKDGRHDYSSLDELTKTRLHRFATAQRDIYQRFEGNPNDANPQTKQILLMLKNANFNFKPQQTFIGTSCENMPTIVFDPKLYGGANGVAAHIHHLCVLFKSTDAFCRVLSFYIQDLDDKEKNNLSSSWLMDERLSEEP